MDVVDQVRRNAGVLPRSRLPRRALARALSQGRLVALGRSLVAVPDLPEPQQSALSVGGVLSCASAAGVHGLPLIAARRSLHVTVPRSTSGRWGRAVVVHRRDVACLDGATTLARTAADCARCLPELEAVAVVDAVLNRGVELDLVVAELFGRGARAARAVVAMADGRSQSSGESVARVSLVRAGLQVEPQVFIADVGWVDLLVEGRVVVEVDGFAYHADAKQFAIDRRRDATLVSMGYRVLRFTWVDVVTRPAYVVEMVRRAVALAA